MHMLKRAVVTAISTVCAFSAIPFCAQAVSHQYKRENYWYYSDDTSFRYTDFGADESGYYDDGATVDFYGMTPAGLYESGKTSYKVTFGIGDDTMDFTVRIGLRYDANMDGVINVRDSAFIARNSAGENNYESDFAMFLSDADNDGFVSVRDAAIISRIVSVESAKRAAEQLEIKKERINRVVELVNIERAKEGLKPLQLDDSISRVSSQRANEIATYFSHKRPDGTQWSELLNQYKITYSYAGENIAAGYTTPEAVVEGWMNSEGHRENILDPYFTKIGIGYYYSSSSEYGHYWVQTFVQP